MLSGDNVDHGQNGYYLASSGSIAWHDLYAAMAKALAKRNVVDDETVRIADDDILGKMGEALRCPKEMVPLQLGGR
jgi:acetyl-CoA acetyltransferase